MNNLCIKCGSLFYVPCKKKRYQHNSLIAWNLVEPMIGIEPMTYSLRVKKYLLKINDL